MRLLGAKQVGTIAVLVIAAIAVVAMSRLAKAPEEPKTKAPKSTQLLAAHVNPSVKAFDSGNEINDPAWFNQAYTAGFRLYIIHSVHWDSCDIWTKAQPQIQNALAAGLKVAAYTRDPNCWKSGILAAGSYQAQLQFFAIDVETDPGIPATQEMINGIKAMGVRPIIYTNAEMWPKIRGTSANSFSSLSLWDTDVASFPYESWAANYLSPKPIPFNGWNTQANMRIAVQQNIEYTLNGVNIDLDSFDATFLK